MLPGSSVVLMFPLSLRNMNQQVVLESSQKERTTFGTLPEGLVPPIVKFVRRWAEKEQTGKDWRVRIDLGRIERDRALLSVASTSRSFFSKCYPHLLQNATITVLTLPSVYPLLQRDPTPGLQIQQLVLRNFKHDPTVEERASFFKLWATLKSAAGRELTQVEAESVALRRILSKCQNLQTLLLEGGIPFNLTDLFNGRDLPIPFLPYSLKQLYLAPFNQRKRSMTAQNMIWI